MSKFKNIGALMAMYMAGVSSPFHRIPEASDEEKIKKLENNQKAFPDKYKEKYGLKEFKYGDNVIYARNKKNADRKAKNKGFL